MPIEDSYNFRRVDERVTTSGVVPKEVLEGLAGDGVEVLINLLPADSRYAVPGEADIVGAQGIDYVYIPVNFERPTACDYRQFEAAMMAAAGKRVHVHCAANYRVSAFYSLYAVRAGRWTSAEADGFVGSLWAPEEHSGWPGFMEAVRKP